MNISHSLHSPYMQFSRQQWAELRNTEPLPPIEQQLSRLQGINEELSLSEIEDIYLPLSRLISFYIRSNITRQAVLDQFLGISKPQIPYIISIAGSVAVGKSTTARVLQELLKNRPEYNKVELVTTDGFLHSNAVLQERGLMKKKGFPESYDIRSLLRFVSDIKSGVSRVSAPVYSHLVYDIVPDEVQLIEQPDILILEGLNVLQSGMDYPHEPHQVFVSDFVDFSVYVDACEQNLQTWYIERFLKLRQSAFSDPNSYFHNYVQLAEQDAIALAKQTWQEINLRNLHKNILPTRERANLILMKGNHHEVESIKLRK